MIVISLCVAVAVYYGAYKHKYGLLGATCVALWYAITWPIMLILWLFDPTIRRTLNSSDQ